MCVYIAARYSGRVNYRNWSVEAYQDRRNGSSSSGIWMTHAPNGKVPVGLRIVIDQAVFVFCKRLLNTCTECGEAVRPFARRDSRAHLMPAYPETYAWPGADCGADSTNNPVPAGTGTGKCDFHHWYLHSGLLDQFSYLRNSRLQGQTDLLFLHLSRVGCLFCFLSVSTDRH